MAVLSPVVNPGRRLEEHVFDVCYCGYLGFDCRITPFLQQDAEFGAMLIDGALQQILLFTTDCRRKHED